MWKNTYTISCGFLWIALTATLVPVSAAELERELEAVDARVVTWRRDFHQNPELSNREVRTAKVVADHLKKLGLEVRTGIAKTGVLGVLKTGRPGPVIALRADMDALPVTERTDVPFRSVAKSNYRGEEVGVMHACGHDSHVAVLMGVAEALTNRKADLRGTVLFVFQPAEEGAPPGEEGGASIMLREGVFKDYKPEVMFGWHAWSSLNTGQIGYRSGPFFADSHAWRAVVTGRQAHGSAPWKGVDPIVVSAQIVNAMQTVVSRQTDITEIPAAFSVGAIKGGVRNNIIPDTVEMIGTLRTFSPEQKAKMVASASRLFEKTAEASGATATFELDPYYNPVTVNDPKLTARMLPTVKRVVGETNVLEVPLVTGAEDFAYFAREIPSFYFAVGVTPVGQDAVAAPVNHSPLFYLDEKALPLATRAMTAIAVDYLK
jgi:amidohydrolase